jgi:hypothetical protein
VHRVLLVEHRSVVNPGAGGSFRKFAAVRVSQSRRRRITLASLNGRYRPVTLELSRDVALRFVAELVTVLDPMALEASPPA